MPQHLKTHEGFYLLCMNSHALAEFQRNPCMSLLPDVPVWMCGCIIVSDIILGSLAVAPINVLYLDLFVLLTLKMTRALCVTWYLSGIGINWPVIETGGHTPPTTTTITIWLFHPVQYSVGLIFFIHCDTSKKICNWLNRTPCSCSHSLCHSHRRAIQKCIPVLACGIFSWWWIAGHAHNLCLKYLMDIKPEIFLGLWFYLERTLPHSHPCLAFQEPKSETCSTASGRTWFRLQGKTRDRKSVATKTMFVKVKGEKSCGGILEEPETVYRGRGEEIEIV